MSTITNKRREARTNDHATAYREPTWTCGDGECFSDTGNGARLAANRAGVLRYVPAWGWLTYEGGAWRRDSGSTRVMEQARDVLRAMAAEHLGCGTNHEQTEWLRHIKYSFNHVEQMVRAARTTPALAADVADFDTDPMLLNVQNGTLDLRTGALRPHDPTDLLTKQANVVYDPTATAPAWDAFLSAVFGGDTDLIAWVQKALGYSLTGDTREQVFFLCYGSGANGKSTLFEAVRAVLGDYASPLKADALMDSGFRSGAAADPELSALVGARFVTAAEPREPGGHKAPRLDTGRIKALTGGDAIQVRELYGKPFTLVPHLKLWMAVNNRPEVPESTVGIWRRIRLIPFEQSFEGREDRTMPLTLRREGSGILHWLVEGVRRWQQDDVGLGDPPAAVREATGDYRSREDEYQPFFTDALVRDKPTSAVRLDTAWRAFQQWKKANPYATEWVKDSRGLARIAEGHGLPKRRRTRDPHKGQFELVGCRLAVELADDDDDDDDAEDAAA